MSTGRYQTFEHPLDVLAQLLTWQQEGAECALVVITKTEGGSVRSAGSLMAVRQDSVSAGYISGGCIDADVIAQCQLSMSDGANRVVRYGLGSPYQDLPLPCGGAITVMIIPAPDKSQIEVALAHLSARRPCRVVCSEETGFNLVDAGIATGALTFTYYPKLRVRIAGRGADCLALAQLCDASGIETVLQLVDPENITAADTAGLENICALETPKALPAITDDAWTAFILMFHDSDWENLLLEQALKADAFYIGAVGSRRTHAKRCAGLRTIGFDEDEIARVHGPVGLVPAMRDASMLAVSALAEIVQVYHAKLHAASERTALILLAAGASSRFQDGDKLLAELDGRSVLDASAQLGRDAGFAARIAVTGPKQEKRAAILEQSDWHVVLNSNAKDGQSTSLHTAMDYLQDQTGIEQVIIMLADMPHIPDTHLEALLKQRANGYEAVMTESAGTLLPPALFGKAAFKALRDLEADGGAKSVFLRLTNTATVPLNPELAKDIDYVEDLLRARELMNG